MVEKFNALLDDYIKTDIQEKGLPTGAYFSGSLNLSTRCFVIIFIIY